MTEEERGGGSFNDGTLVCCASSTIGYADNVTIAANSAQGVGGGVYTTNGGSSIFRNATIADNSASGGGGGLYNDDITSAFYGAAEHAARPQRRQLRGRGPE